MKVNIKRQNILKRLPIIIFIIFIILYSFFLLYSSPEKLINFIGIENAYFLIFVLAFIGGLSTFSGVPYHLVLIALATGGLNPVFLGLSASFGVMLGDSTSYLIGYHGSAIFPGPVQNFLRKLLSYFMKHPKLLPLFFLFYGSFVPFSNDFIVITMGLARYPFWRVMIPLGMGNIIFNVSLAFLAIYANGFLQKLFF